MNNYKYEFDGIIFTLSIKYKDDIITQSDDSYQSTILYANNLVLIENKKTKYDFYFDILKLMSEYSDNSIEERLILNDEFKKYSLFTNDNFYFKSHKNDMWHIIEGKDYDDFYDWLTFLLLPKGNIKKERRVKLNKLIKNDNT